jgi:hypothetical protein
MSEVKDAGELISILMLLFHNYGRIFTICTFFSTSASLTDLLASIASSYFTNRVRQE